MDLTTLTAVHTALSLVAIIAGIPAMAGLFRGRIAPVWTPLFLGTAIATSVTGYFFPFNGILPSHVVGAVALLVLAVTLYAAYGGRHAGVWRWIYAIGIVVSQYLLVFVLVAQAFLKVPALHALAPTQAEPPFAVAQLITLAVFILLGVRAARRFGASDAPDAYPRSASAGGSR
ncbi:hypothetical protein [Ancylobacter terrae]|uniref:hypothetical protein n=1 Tax=Ancylobacter sp. sgz301288 TaxID=3342077 RepID=UPI00385B79FB